MQADYKTILRITRYTINKNATKSHKARFYDILESSIFDYITRAYNRYNGKSPLITWLCLNAYYGYLDAVREISQIEKKEIERNIATKEYILEKGHKREDPLIALLHKENREYSKELLDEMCFRSGVTDKEKEKLVEFVDGQHPKDIVKKYTCSSSQIYQSINNAIKKIKEVVEV
jgi:hypothetical protein